MCVGMCIYACMRGYEWLFLSHSGNCWVSSSAFFTLVPQTGKFKMFTVPGVINWSGTTV